MLEATTRPLDGVRVLDLSNLLAGPMTTMFLADFGADVIKVEHPEHGDELRGWGHSKDDVGLYFKVLNRNKRLISLNLGRTRGRELAAELAAGCDVVVEAFRPGTMARWGLDYATLSERNPGLIMAHISGYGQTGPLSHRPGFGTIAEAFSGFAAITGYEDAPLLPPFGLADASTAIFTAFGIVLALRQRDRTGDGQELDAALYEGLFTLLGPHVIDYDQLGIVARREGSRLAFVSPRNTFQTADGEWVAIAGSTQATFERLARGFGRGHLIDDPRFATNRLRMEHAEELDTELGEAIAAAPLEEVLRILDEAAAPGGPVLDAAGIFAHPHYAARENIVTLEDEELRQVRMQAVAPRLSRSPGCIEHPGRQRGADNAAVYGDLLGLSAAELEALRADGVIS